MYAATNGYPEVVKLLLEKGAKTETKDGDDKTALNLATEMGNTEVVKLLQERGAH